MDVCVETFSGAVLPVVDVCIAPFVASAQALPVRKRR
jgi:hypothetical protein